MDPDLDGEYGWRDLASPATYALLVAMVAGFVAVQAVFRLAGPEFAAAVLGLSVARPEYVWTWFTSPLTHVTVVRGGLGALAWNAVVLFGLGRPVEMAIGSRRFVGAAVVGGFVAVTVNGFLGNGGATFGAAAAVAAVVAVPAAFRPSVRVGATSVPYWVVVGGLFFLVVTSTLPFRNLAGLLVGVAYGLVLRRGGFEMPDPVWVGGVEWRRE